MTGVRAVDTQLIVVKDQAFTPDEYVRWRRNRDRTNARHRERMETDPEYREHYLAYHRAYSRAWRLAHPDKHRAIRDRYNEQRRQQRAEQRAAAA